MLVASLGSRFTPLMIAALLAWVLCVCVHEFSHALVAYLGGDKSVRQKGYLSLDPTRFIDPMTSLLIPALMLALGGLPLPGGAVMIDESSLKSRRWAMYVSAAGPAGNVLLFLLFALPLHPMLGLVHRFVAEQPTWVYFCGAMAYLNFIAALFNLIPVPPMDGYRLIEHRLSYEMQWKLRQPQVTMATFGLLFMMFWVFPWVWIPFDLMFGMVTSMLGLPADLIHGSYYFVFWS